MTNWLDTRKFKPQTSGSYLVCDGGIVQLMHFDATKGRFYAHWWSDILCTERFPTHWMPMPDAPKEVHDAEE